MKPNTQYNDLRSWIIRRALISLLALFAFSSQAQANYLFNYNAASGNYPDNFTNLVYKAGGPGVAYDSVSGGILYLVQEGYHNHALANFDFSSYSNMYVLAASLYIVHSDYTAINGIQRSGHYFEAYDSTGHGFELGISSGGVTLNTDSVGAVGQGIPATAFNSTTGFHEYKVVARGGQASLYIDGKTYGSATFVTNLSLGPEIGFGDLAGSLGIESGAAEVQYLMLSASPYVPDIFVNSANSCDGSPVVLTATTTAINPSFLWSPGGSTNASIIVSPTSTTSYTVTVTDGPTGATNSASATVAVYALPSVSVAPVTDCAGEPVVLTATTTATNPIYLWTPGGFTNASVIVSPTTNMTYTVLVTDGTTGCANSATGTVTVTTSPGVFVNSPATCPGNSVTLTAITSASNPSYLWTPGGSTGASITVSPSVTSTYTVTVTDGTTGCIGSGSGTVYIVGPPIVNSVSTCPGVSAMLTAKTYANNPTYLWSPGGETNASIIVNPAATTTYTVTVTDGNTGCSFSGTGTVSLKATNGIAYVYGDSVDQGYLVAPTNRFSALICSDTGLTEDNLAQGGTQIADEGETAAVVGTPIGPTDRSLWLAGFNDMRFYGTNAAALTDNASAFQSLVAWLAIPASVRIPATDPRITYSGGWSYYSPLGGLMYSSVANATATVTLAGRNVLIGTARGGGSGNLTVVVDGTYTNVYSCLRTAASTARGINYSAGLIVFTNLPDTLHTVVMTADSSLNTFICWVAGYTGDQGPSVALSGTEKCAEFEYSQLSPFNNGSDAAAAAYSAMVSNTAVMLACADLNVVWTNAPVFDTNTEYESDFLHPNELGHIVIKNQMLPLISGFPLANTPQPVLQYPGATASFSAATTGSNVSYQWQANTGTGFTNIYSGTGFNGPGYTTPQLALANNGTQYRCVISAGCGFPPTSTDPALLSVVAGPPQGLLLPPATFGMGTNVQVKLIGSPSTSYALEWTHNLLPPVAWQLLATNNADSNGWVIYTNTPSTNPADFYRAVELP